MEELTKELLKIGGPLAAGIVKEHVLPVAASFVKGRMSKLRSKKKILSTVESYVKRLYGECSIIQTIAFSSEPRRLDELYVPLTLVDIAGGELIISDQADVFSVASTVVILDAAGMGKSTVVKRLILNSIISQKHVPVLYELRAFPKDGSLESEVLRVLGLPSSTPTSAFDQIPLRLYLDGLDEAPSALAPSIVEQIARFRQNHPSVQILVSSRRQREVNDLLKYHLFKVKDLTIDQACELIKKYDSGGTLSKELVRLLRKENIERIRDYLSNPLYVSLLYCAFRHKQALPQKMCLFYEQVYNALFDQHDLTKAANYRHELKTGLDCHEFSLVLRRLAFVCLIDGFRVECTRSDFEDKVKKVKEDINHLEFKISDFAKDATASVPIFIDDGATIRWGHKSLLEFFASMFICYDAEGLAGELLISLLESEDASQYKHIFEICADIHYKTFRDSVGRHALRKFIDHSKKSYTQFANKRISKADLERRRAATFATRSVFSLSDKGLGFTVQPVETSAQPIKHSDGDVAIEGLRMILEKFQMASGEIERDKRSSPLFNIMMGPKATFICYREISPERWILSTIIQKEGARNKWFVDGPEYSELEEMTVERQQLLIVTDDPSRKFNKSSNFSKLTDILVFHEEKYLTLEEAENIISNIDSNKSHSSLLAMVSSLSFSKSR
jgi:hypothetical protein